jgi:predicted aconitase with swiveling domain
MLQTGIAPKAIIFNSVNTILAQGAAFAELTMVDRFECLDVTQEIQTGDDVHVDPLAGRVTILNRD